MRWFPGHPSICMSFIMYFALTNNLSEVLNINHNFEGISYMKIHTMVSCGYSSLQKQSWAGRINKRQLSANIPNTLVTEFMVTPEAQHGTEGTQRSQKLEVVQNPPKPPTILNLNPLPREPSFLNLNMHSRSTVSPSHIP